MVQELTLMESELLHANCNEHELLSGELKVDVVSIGADLFSILFQRQLLHGGVLDITQNFSSWKMEIRSSSAE